MAVDTATLKDKLAEYTYLFAIHELYGMGECVHWTFLMSQYLQIEAADDDGIGFLEIETGCKPLIVQ